MKKRRQTAAMKACLILLLAACGSTAGTSTKRDTLTSIPPAASAALQRAAGGAQIEEIDREGDLYEASWHVNGLEHEAAVTAAGELVEREEEVPSELVPPPVRAVAVAKSPQATNVKFVKLLNGNYEVEAGDHEVTVSPDGREVGDDDDDDDRDDDD